MPPRTLDERRVTLELSINSTNAWATQRLLRTALGDAARILTVSVNYKRNRSCFHISAGRSAMSTVMDTVISALPEAELGIVRSLQ